MSTYVTVEDIHANVKVVDGICPEDYKTIVVDNYLGGGGNPNNYYFNWFKQFSDPNAEFSYLTPKCGQDDTITSVTLTITLSNPTYYAIKIDQIYFIDYGINPVPVATVISDLVNGLTGFGRVITTTPNSVTIVFLPNDPGMLLIGCGNYVSHTLYINPFPNLGLFALGPLIHCCGTTPTLQQIKGFEPLGGGVGVVSFTASQGSGNYLVEIVDETGEANYGLVEILNIVPGLELIVTQPTCAGKKNGSIKVGEFFDNSLGVTFAWTKDNVPFSNQMDIYYLEPATYCLTISNTDNCSRVVCATIVDPLPLQINIIELLQPTCVSCPNNTRFGSLIFEVVGGNTDCRTSVESPYSYSLNGAPFLPLDFDDRKYLLRLTEGKYNLKVRDCVNCLTSYDFVIKEEFINFNI